RECGERGWGPGVGFGGGSRPFTTSRVVAWIKRWRCCAGLQPRLPKLRSGWDISRSEALHAPSNASWELRHRPIAAGPSARAEGEGLTGATGLGAPDRAPPLPLAPEALAWASGSGTDPMP